MMLLCCVQDAQLKRVNASFIHKMKLLTFIWIHKSYLWDKVKVRNLATGNIFLWLWYFTLPVLNDALNHLFIYSNQCLPENSAGVQPNFSLKILIKKLTLS